MGLQKTADKVVGILSSVDMVYIISPDERSRVDMMLGMVVTDLEKLENDETVEPTQDDVDTIHNVLNFCKRLVLDEPITERLSELIRSLCLLMHNWNINLSKDGVVHKDVKFLNNAIDQHFTIVQGIEILKRILGKIDNLNYGCDNINSISTHYLQALDKIHGEEEDDCKEDRCI